MLYGIDTSERDRAGYLSDKTRFRPWGGYPMEGTIDIVRKGENITLRRRALGSSPMRDVSAIYTGTDEPVSGLEAMK
jgi:hypothetical protein